VKKLILLSTALMLIIPDVALAQHRTQQVQRSKTTVTKQARTSRQAARPQAARHASGPQATRSTRTVVRPQATRSTIRTSTVRRPQVQQSRVVNRTTTYRPGTLRTSRFRPIQRPAFRYPRGYSYRRWSIGSLLPSLFLSNNYYFNDYAALGVGPPPYGYHWVRYGPDLLLVQNGTRRIVDVIYGAFY
jgi:Ni/Co efflux regulator RcnB